MGTSLSELTRRVLLGIKDLRGEDILIAEESLNQACTAIAKVHNFDELVTWDKTHAVTVDGTHRYHLSTNLLLTRPKDVISIIAHDDDSSTNLKYREPQWMDENYPYPETIEEAIPEIFTQRDNYIEFIPIPDDAYPLYIRYSQWPATMTSAVDCSYSNLDSEILALGREIFIAYRAGLPLNAILKAKMYLKIGMNEDRSNPAALPVAEGFSTTKAYKGEYWKDPFVRGS